jgi:hypothetical protein
MGLTELQQVNAVVGLGMKIGKWPSTLADHGYTLDKIELKFRITDKSQPGVNLVINPDLLYIHEVRNISLIIELKSGTYQGFKQLDGFVSVTAIDLYRYGRVPLDTKVIADHEIHVVQIINTEFLDEYLPEFERLKHKACLWHIDKDAIQAKYGNGPDNNLHRTISTGVSFKGYRIPTRLVPALPTSDDRHSLVVTVVKAVMHFWSESNRTITPLQVAEDQYGSLWGLFGTEAQSQYLKIAEETLDDMARCEFHHFMRFGPGESKWTLLRLPNTASSGQATKTLQNFQTTMSEYTQRRLHKKKYTGFNPSQENILDIPGVVREEKITRRGRKKTTASKTGTSIE